MGRIEKTIFLSYRRTDEWEGVAIFQDLTQHGYDVFIDYDGIASGNFEAVILENIRARAHFLVLLTPAALERCSNPKDWMRREIEAALDSQRNIVPLMFAGFDFDTPAIASRLTGKLAALREYNGLEVPKARFFASEMQRLRDKFLNVPVDAVLHPASDSAQQVAKEQKDKASSEAKRRSEEEARQRSAEEARQRTAEEERRKREAEIEQRRSKQAEPKRQEDETQRRREVEAAREAEAEAERERAEVERRAEEQKRAESEAQNTSDLPASVKDDIPASVKNGVLVVLGLLLVIIGLWLVLAAFEANNGAALVGGMLAITSSIVCFGKLIARATKQK
jgi:hypothetical protein